MIVEDNTGNKVVKRRGAEEVVQLPTKAVDQNLKLIDNIPHCTNDMAILQLFAEALRYADHLVTISDNSNRPTYVAPVYIKPPTAEIFLTDAKAMRSYNELLAAVRADFHADQFLADLGKLDFSQLCGVSIPAVKGLQSRINRNFGMCRGEYAKVTAAINRDEPYSKDKHKRISERIKVSARAAAAYDDILTTYDDIDNPDYEQGTLTWTIGGCAHAFIVAKLLERPTASKNVLASEFLSSNKETIIASYVQFAVIRAFRDFAGGDLPRWQRLLSLVGYGQETVLRGDVIGLTFGMIRLEKYPQSPRTSAWCSEPLTPDALFVASCALCGKPSKQRIKWGDILSGRVFSCGCSAPKTMYKPALARLKAAAIDRFKAKKSECASTGEKDFFFSSEEHFLESVGLPWGHGCLDLSRFEDHKYNNVPYAPGHVLWECSKINRSNGGKATKRKRVKLPLDYNAPKLPYALSDFAPYEYAPGYQDKPSLESLRSNFWEVRSTRDENRRIKSSIKTDTYGDAFTEENQKCLERLIQRFQEDRLPSFGEILPTLAAIKAGRAYTDGVSDPLQGVLPAKHSTQNLQHYREKAKPNLHQLQ
ncbi:hypothetical protein [Solidesulfovibrio carbinolicus]|uniref:Uncharacterized protein n=1 Tax=Solidesulfovibrio carbinolicus TaxID=296842 RepID=A0A4P6HS31_9BACT|nr:hypothetical protein [Solidesulfovibrio carbinolicus]QAZ69686.1 hypothetical protein C3Y92_20635 [Solidesulfovibrio carbinolicus]